MNTMIDSATSCRPFGLAFDKEIAPEEKIVRGVEARSLLECGPGMRIRVLEGILWITQEGDAVDYLVGTGDTFVCTRVGRIVVESLAGDSRFIVL